MPTFSLNEKQLILYGAPGTGKSFGIDATLTSYSFDMDKDVIRVVFHKDYSYSDFVGALYPQNKGGGLDYDFQPGPFTIALEKAFETKRNVCLLIEEMNRGNCGAIFGDIFQLLDRDATGVSVYPVVNSDIRNYLNNNSSVVSALKRWDIGQDDILIPSNLFIIGTMNTADQNVFFMDSAFKRRFKSRYSPIEFVLTEPHLMKLDNISKTTLFDGVKTWSDFAQAVNAKIDKINSDMIMIPEDKKLGPYFVDEVDVSCKQAFCDKVIYYLKNDVFKYVDSIFFDSYENMYEKYVNDDRDFFECLEER